MKHIVVVTGAAGFAGSHLVQHLATSAEVVGLSRSEPPPEVIGLAAWRRVDILDRDQVRRTIADIRPSVVYHCAGLAHVAQSWQNTAAPLETNVLGTHHLLEAIRRTGRACRVLVPGSAAVYAASSAPIAESDPIAPASPYALSKLAQEQLAIRAAREDGLDVVATRSFNHTGARQSPDYVAPGFARQIALIERGEADPVIRVGNLEARRDLTDVRDVVRAYVALVERGQAGEIYNVASGVAHTMRSLLDALIARARVQVTVETDPERMRPNDVPSLVGDAAKLREATGWEPSISFDQMLDDLLAYWRESVGSR